MIYIILGIISWSLGHYIVHRILHYLLSLKKINHISDGENNHHLIYDDNSNNRDKDIGARYVTFPYNMALLTLLLLIGLISLFSTNIALLFSIGYIFGMAVDDIFHSICHFNNKKKFFNKIVEIHNIHHRDHDCNFGFFFGLIYDVIFFTIRLK